MLLLGWPWTLILLPLPGVAGITVKNRQPWLVLEKVTAPWTKCVGVLKLEKEWLRNLLWRIPFCLDFPCYGTDKMTSLQSNSAGENLTKDIGFLWCLLLFHEFWFYAGYLVPDLFFFNPYSFVVVDTGIWIYGLLALSRQGTCFTTW
jgi:hypothetical protein